MLNPDFRDMLSALNAEHVEFLLAGIHVVPMPSQRRDCPVSQATWTSRFGVQTQTPNVCGAPYSALGLSLLLAVASLCPLAWLWPLALLSPLVLLSLFALASPLLFAELSDDPEADAPLLALE